MNIRLEDIAETLSKLCRYNGHCPGFYSVAQHSVHVAEMCTMYTAAGEEPMLEAVKAGRHLEGEPSWVTTLGLLHDASEAYLGDVSKILKDLNLMVGYKVLEILYQRAIAKRFGLPKSAHSIVGLADHKVFLCEVRDIWGEDPRKGPWDAQAAPTWFKIKELWTPEEAKRRFLEKAEELGIAV